MTKYNILRDIFNKTDSIFIFENFFGIKNASTKEEEFIQLISKDIYRLDMYKGISLAKLNKLILEIFPDKPKGRSIKLDKWILGKYNYRFCRRCNTLKFINDFTFNKSKSDGLNCQCKVCQIEQTTKTQRARQAKYKASKIGAVVPWSNLEDISLFYSKCPEGFQVDHIVPLQGEKVSGLHVLSNLQYLSKFDNLSKNNKFAE
jgi:hypothetical protein